MTTNPTPWSPDEAAVERIIRAVFKETRVDLRALKKDEAKKVSRAVISESPLARAVELLDTSLQGFLSFKTEKDRAHADEVLAFLRDLGKEESDGS